MIGGLSTAYSYDKDSNIKVEDDMKNEARLSMFDKGQSKRIWGELFKALDLTPLSSLSNNLEEAPAGGALSSRLIPPLFC